MVLVVMITSILVHQAIFVFGYAPEKEVATGFESAPRSLASHINDANSRTTLDDLFLSIKSTCNLHKRRLRDVLRTWFQLVPNQTWIFTDCNDPELQKTSNGHVINTHCPSNNAPVGTCCKFSMMLEAFVKSGKNWFCYVHDDNYVNVPRLLELLGNCNPQEDWFLGRPNSEAQNMSFSDGCNNTNVSFRFAVGGAGFCLSHALVLKMIPFASMRNFTVLFKNYKASADAIIGYIIGHLLRKHLTAIEEFHSHHEALKLLQQDTLHNQITFSYGKNGMNVVQIDGFDKRIDPTRFLSIHCFFFPNVTFCPKT